LAWIVLFITLRYGQGEGQVGSRASEQILEGASAHFIQPFKNVFFSKNLELNMPKNAYFFKKEL